MVSLLRKQWSICSGIWWSVCPGNGGQFKLESGGQFHRFFQYNTQKDLAAELIIKSKIYNDSYKKMLMNTFNKLYGKNPMMFKRIIVGNYTERNEIHKRPMSKFTQDIARQLKLI